MNNFFEILGLLLIGFVVGLFSPIKLAVRIGRRHQPQDAASKVLDGIIESLRRNGKDDIAEIADKLARGVPSDQVINEMSPATRRRFDAWQRKRGWRRKGKE